MTAEPFSFRELTAQPTTTEEGGDPSLLPTTTTATVLASDGIELAVHVYEPPPPKHSKSNTNNTNAALVFYHGGGAHGGAGYQHIGRGLARDHGITVYLPDLRGHGASGGPRGDAPSKEQVWEDIDTVLSWVAATKSAGKNDNKPRIFLGGHSSGGGLVVNYATKNNKNATTEEEEDGGGTTTATDVDIDGYVLVAPELGYASGTAKPGRTDFAEVNILSFIMNGICGIRGHHHAVKFRYPKKILEDDPGMVGSNTVNMANAITPDKPKEQVSAMSSGSSGSSDSGGGQPPEQPRQQKPVGLWIGADDELFTAEAVAGFVDTKNKNVAEVLPGKTHLGILVDVHEPIGRWIGELRS